MVINVRKKSGKRYIAKHGPQRLIVDGREEKDAFYADTRRKRFSRFVRDADGKYLLTPDRKGLEVETIRCKRLRFVPVCPVCR